MSYNIMVPFIYLLCFALLCGSLSGQSDPAAALTDAQKQTLKALEADSAKQAGPLLLKIGAAAKSFDRNILAAEPDQELDRRYSTELVDAIAEAIRMRIASVREIARVLTPEQKKLLLAELEKPGANPDLPSLMETVFAQKKK